MPQISPSMQKTDKQETRNLRAKIQNSTKLKVFCLGAVFTSSCIAIFISLLVPTPKKHSQFQLPKQITLANWRSQPSNDLEENLKGNAIVAQRYTYTSSTQGKSQEDLGKDLRIDLLYIEAAVDVPKQLRLLGLKFVSKYADQRYLATSGHYVLFSDQDRAYLASCINPRGGSTVSGQQFIDNRNIYDITPPRVGLYIIGMTDLRDTRCLFTIMSIPLDSKDLDNQSGNSLDNVYQKLENTWTDWYKNWENNFPEN